MEVLRKQEIICSYDEVKVGDQININLTGFGEFTATAQKITDKGIVFLFDDCVADMPMNNDNINEGGYKKSDLYEWINTELLNAFPDEIKSRIINLTIPTYGQIFGHDDFYCNLEPEEDEDEQFPLMEKRKNRITDSADDYKWYWLQNAVKTKMSSAVFADVTGRGDAHFYAASLSSGVRPVFLLA